MTGIRRKFLKLAIRLPMLFSMAQILASETQFDIDKQYPNFPLSHEQERSKMTFTANGEEDWSVVVRWVPPPPDYWVFYDVSPLKGKNLKIAFQGDGRGIRVFIRTVRNETQTQTTMNNSIFG
ncbi:MAG: hypothetical protein ACTHXT_13265 [Sphingobacterium sp.]